MQQAYLLRADNTKRFTIAVSAYDCTGCGSCVEVCPARNKALEMVLAEDHMDQAQAGYDYLFANTEEDKALAQPDSVRGSQFRQPRSSSPVLVRDAAKLLMQNW